MAGTKDGSTDLHCFAQQYIPLLSTRTNLNKNTQISAFVDYSVSDLAHIGMLSSKFSISSRIHA